MLFAINKIESQGDLVVVKHFQLSRLYVFCVHYMSLVTVLPLRLGFFAKNKNIK